MSQDEADDFSYRGVNEGSKLGGASELWLEGNLVSDSKFGISGFAVLPTGRRVWVPFDSTPGRYLEAAIAADFWSATEYDDYKVWRRKLRFNFSSVFRYPAYKNNGFSVRCVKD